MSETFGTFRTPGKRLHCRTQRRHVSQNSGNACESFSSYTVTFPCADVGTWFHFSHSLPFFGGGL